MFKNLSAVNLLLLIFMTFMSSNVLAQTTTTSTQPVYDREVEDSKRLDQKQEQFRARCESAKSDWKTTVTEFQGLCAVGASLGIGSDLASCAKAIKCCLESNSDNCDHEGSSTALKSELEKTNNILEEILDQKESMDSENPNFSMIQQLEDKERALQNRRSLYVRCPMRGAVGIDDAYEEAEEARDKLEERQDSINDLQEQINTAQTELEENQLKLQNEMKELEAKTKTELKEIRDQQEGAIKKLLEAIEARQASIRELQMNITQAEQQKAEVAAQFDQKHTELKMNCYNEAVEKAQNKRNLIIQKAAKGEYSAGDMNNLMKSVGSSTLEDTQKLVEYHRSLCLVAPPFREAVRLALAGRERAIRLADETIQSINKQILVERAAISKLQSNEKLKVHQDTMEKIEILQQAYEDKLQSLQAQYAQLMQSSSRQISQLQQQMAQKQAHLQAAQEHLTYKNSILDIAKKATNGGDTSISKDDWQKLIGGYAGVQLSADAINENCACETGSVQAARDFISAIGRTPENCLSSYEDAAGGRTPATN